MHEPDVRTPTPARGRRSVVVGAAAAVAGWLAAGATPLAAAATGDPVVLGRRNEASATTTIATDADTAMRARAPGPGSIAIDGVSVGGTGVHGLSRDANGVSGESVFGTGVSGHSIEPGSYAVSGDSNEGVGVQGGSHRATGVQGNSQFGVAVSGGNVSETEPAVRGWAQNGQTGVMGRSTEFDEFDEIASPLHVGVFGVADRPGGRGVLARSREGRALQANGRVRFSTSGVAVIGNGEASVTVTPSFRVVASAKVLATLQSDPGGGVAVGYATVDPDAGTFTIHTTGTVGADTNVAWFVMD